MHASHACAPAASSAIRHHLPESCAEAGPQQTRGWKGFLREGRRDRTCQRALEKANTGEGEGRGRESESDSDAKWARSNHEAPARPLPLPQPNLPPNLVPLTRAVTPCTASPSCDRMLPACRFAFTNRPSLQANTSSPPSHAASSVRGTCKSHTAAHTCTCQGVCNAPAPCVQPYPCGS